MAVQDDLVFTDEASTEIQSRTFVEFSDALFAVCDRYGAQG